MRDKQASCHFLSQVKYFLFDWLIIKYICRNIGLRQDAQALTVITRDIMITNPASAALFAATILSGNIVVHHHLCYAKTLLKYFSRLVCPHLQMSVAEIKWMVAKTLFILFLLHNIIFDNSQCAASLTSAVRGNRPVGPPLTTPLWLWLMLGFLSIFWPGYPFTVWYIRSLHPVYIGLPPPPVCSVAECALQTCIISLLQIVVKLDAYNLMTLLQIEQL